MFARLRFKELGLRKLRSYAEATELDNGEGTHSDIKRIANLGARGKCPANLEHDFLRMNKRDLKMLRHEPYQASVPLKERDSVEFHNVTLIAPHEDVTLLYDCDRKAFREVFGSPAARKGYWDEVGSSSPWFASHPGSAAVLAGPALCVPIRWHGAGVAVNRGT